MLRWNASCLATVERNDNLMFAKPEREKSTSRIDGLSASTNAMARAMLGEQNVYSGIVRSVGRSFQERLGANHAGAGETNASRIEVWQK